MEVFSRSLLKALELEITIQTKQLSEICQKNTITKGRLKTGGCAVSAKVFSNLVCVTINKISWALRYINPQSTASNAEPGEHCYAESSQSYNITYLDASKMHIATKRLLTYLHSCGFQWRKVAMDVHMEDVYIKRWTCDQNEVLPHIHGNWLVW